MSDSSVNTQIQEAVRLNQQAVSAPEVVWGQGAGVAHQAVAQSAALAVQDATDYLRSVSMISSTTIAVAAAKMVETEGSSPWCEIIAEAQRAVDRAVESFGAVGHTAGEVLRRFPPAEWAPEQRNGGQ